MPDCFPLGFFAEMIFVVSCIPDSYCACLLGPYFSVRCFEWFLMHMFLLNYDNQYFGKYFLSFALHNCVFSRCLNAFSFPLLVFVCLSFPFLALLFSGFCYRKIPMLDLKLVVVLWFCVFFYYFHKVPICFAEGS